ncbi:MAG: YajQ family cyclic di-GMP-binding protein [Armatimonadota bacterium]|nr:YajQ family cyclic di-GMP-binding protein [Armatimonadota bacterium]
MAKDSSFDIVSRVDMQEVKNAIDQAKRELANRYDFKGSVAEITHTDDKIELVSDDEFKLSQLRDIMESKLIKRSIDLRHVEYGKITPGAKMTVEQTLTLKQGIEQDLGKTISKAIRDSKLKVTSQIQGDELRVSGKDKDDLQKVQALVKGLDLPVPVEFVNYR